MQGKEHIITDTQWWLENKGIPYAPEVFVGYGDHKPLGKRKLKQTTPLFTNMGRPIAAFTSAMPQEVGAAAFTRYSRAKNPIRFIVADEFVGQEGIDLRSLKSNSIADRRAAKNFMTNVMSGYGDDSPSQGGSAQFFAEMVSQLTVKSIEDGRLGVMFIEKSSRYLELFKKVFGAYLFHRAKEIMNSPHASEFVRLTEESFAITAASYPDMLKLVRNKFPQGNADLETWKAATRGKTFDILRVFYSMATLTNVGGSFAGQAAEQTLNKMHVSWSAEDRSVARELTDEIDQVIPALISRLHEDDKYGIAARDFLKTRDQAVAEVADDLVSRGLITPQEVDLELKPEMRVKLVYASSDNVNRVVAGILFPKLNLTESLLDQVSMLPAEDKQRVIDADFAGRTNRRHKPSRAFELAHYQMHIRSQVAEYRDLQRMKMNTTQRQLLTTEIGYGTPEEFKEIEIEFRKNKRNLAEVQEIHMAERNSLFKDIRHDVSPEAAQYVVAFGNYMDWEIDASLRQLYHTYPLRAGEGSHPLYKAIVTAGYFQLPQEDAMITLPMSKYIDFSENDKLDRLNSLEKVRQKQLRMGVRDNDTFGNDED